MAAKATKDKPLTKTEILNALAEGSGLTKKEVTAVLDELSHTDCQEPWQAWSWCLQRTWSAEDSGSA